MKNKSFILAALALAALMSAGCNKTEMADEYPATTDTNTTSIKEVATNAWQQTKEAATNAWAGVKEGATNAWANTKEASTNAWVNTKSATTNAWAKLKNSAQSAADYTYDKKDPYVAGIQADVDALDVRIKELSNKAANATGAYKAEAQTKIQALRDKRAALNAKLDDVKSSTDSNWNDVKTAFKDSYDDVKESFEQAWEWLKDKVNS